MAFNIGVFDNCLDGCTLGLVGYIIALGLGLGAGSWLGSDCVLASALAFGGCRLGFGGVSWSGLALGDGGGGLGFLWCLFGSRGCGSRALLRGSSIFCSRFERIERREGERKKGERWEKKE